MQILKVKVYLNFLKSVLLKPRKINFVILFVKIMLSMPNFFYFWLCVINSTVIFSTFLCQITWILNCWYIIDVVEF